MAIEFRCTGCRVRLHVPTRWGGTTVPCPKCQTRVVVPGAGGEPSATRFETAEVEASIAALEPPPGGVFAASTFALPTAAVNSADSPERACAVQAVVTLPRWVAYTLLGLVPAAGIGLFLLGARFGGPWIDVGRSP